MNREAAEQLRDDLNRTDFVAGPDDDASRHAFKLARIHQPGYTNGEPTFEVLMNSAMGGGSVYLPSAFIQWLEERDADRYVRVDDELTVHIRGHL